MVNREEALELFQSDNLIEIGMRADAMRRKFHPSGVASYIIDRNINYTPTFLYGILQLLRFLPADGP